MSTVVAIMDGPGWTSRTDNIVIVDPAAEQLLWVPRDLWCDSLHNRINVAFARSGHEGVMAALAENDFAVQHSLCLARVAVERALADVDVVVPVERALSYWYPLHPQARIEDGKKVVRFDPPAERLRGERVHQWIGARYAVDRPASDFERLARQQVLVRRLLEEGYPFDRALVDPEQVSSSDPATLDELRPVRATWAFETYTDVRPVTIDGMQVLVQRRDWA